MQFNSTDAAHARTMRRRKLPIETILGFFKNKYIAADIDWLIETLRLKNREYRKFNYGDSRWGGIVPMEERPVVPAEVSARRAERLMLRPLTLTALICGDPLPTESALERKVIHA